MSENKLKNWYSLDNAAKVFPALSASNRKKTYTVCTVLSEDVNKDVLTKAVNVVVDRFPSYKVRLRKGIFWHYFEENTKPIIVCEEENYPNSFLEENLNNYYLFKITYYKAKISLNIYHALTDANGAMEFLKAITFQYLVELNKHIVRDDSIISLEAPSTYSEVKDKYPEVFESKQKNNAAKDKIAFELYGTPFAYDGTGIIIGKIETEQIKKLSKQNDCTITCYITAVLMHCIYNVFIKGKNINNKLITTFIPVNMRKWFETNTLRNFVSYIRITHNYDSPVEFDEILKICKTQMSEKLTLEKLQSEISSNVKIEKNFLLRIAPLFIKDFAIRIGYNMLGDKLHTIGLSNIGIVEIPESMKPFVKDFFFIQEVGNSSKIGVSILSYNNITNISFSRIIKETELEKEFFRFFTNQGVGVEILSNYWEKRI